MRVFELSTRINAVQRSQGDSATAKAAYRACCVIECEREGRTHDYSRKHGLEASEIILPKGAPAWDRSKLWNGAELAERNGKRGKNAGAFKANAQTARDLMFSYPVGLSKEGRLKAARIIARHLVDTHRIGADFNIHEPGKDGDQKNYHCHMLLTTRRFTTRGLGEKAREWDDIKTGPKLSKELRKFIADTLNAELAAEGKDKIARVEYRSFAARGSSQKPQKHLGPGKTHELRKKLTKARTAWEARERKEQRERHGKELAGLKLRQDFDLQRKLAELDSRERKGREQIDRDLAAARKADTPATGFRRVFQIVTRQDMREAFERQTREGQRIEEAAQKKADLKAVLQAERNDFVRGQTEERQRLIDRHNGEDRQLNRAVEHRQLQDRRAEVHARSDFSRSASREQVLEREQGRGRSIERDIPPP